MDIDEMEKDFSTLCMMKIGCEFVGIGNSYFNQKKMLKEKYEKLFKVDLTPTAEGEKMPVKKEI